MTINTYTIHTTQGDANNISETTGISDTMIDSSGGVEFETDYFNEGLAVRDVYRGSKSVSTIEDLKDTDLVMLEGMEVSWATAKSLGYTATVKAMLDKEAGTSSTRVEPKANLDTINPQIEDDIDDRWDDIPMENLADKAGQEGALEGEAQVAASVGLDEMAMNYGLDNEASIEMAADMLSGELRADDPIFTSGQYNHRNVSGMVNTVKDSMAAQAKQELGPDAYKQLQTWASQNPAVKSLLIQHGVSKVKGSHVTWGQVYQLVHERMAR
jgi:hypothetical protein